MTAAPQTFKVKGMHCASCAAIIERTLKKQEGVEAAEANYGTESVTITFDPQKISPQTLSDKVEFFGYELVMPAPGGAATPVNGDADKLKEIADLRHRALTTLPLAVIAIATMLLDILPQYVAIPWLPLSHTWTEFLHHLLPIMATYALFGAGQPYLVGLWRFLRSGQANMDTLVGLGTSVAFVYSFALTAFEDALSPYLPTDHSYYDATIVIIAFITLGKYLEASAKLRTGDAIRKLLGLQAKTALVLRDGKEQEIAINDVKVGDLVIIRPGAKIPVDGVVTEGSSYVDEAAVTGEPMAALKQPGDAIVSGMVNTTGSFTFKASKVGDETFLATIIRMVETAQGSKAPIQGLADRIAAVFVPVVLVIAVIALITWIAIGSVPQALSAFVSVLIIACPCALGLATPTAIIVGVGKGAREGILIKNAAMLERLEKVTIVVVDKTGTLTNGRPELVSMQAQPDALAILAALESKSEHPIAKAIAQRAEADGLTLPTVIDFTALEGKGIRGTVNGTTYHAGNTRLMDELNIAYDKAAIEAEAAQGKTPVLLASDGKLLGTFMVADAVKPQASEAIQILHSMGLDVVMLTGDNKNTASYVAAQLGIKTVHAEVLPQDKLQKVKDLQAQGGIVAMAGDGINDAPALAQADIGIAMGTGTDVAIETADVTLLHGDIAKIAKAIRLSRLTMRTVRQNLFWAFIYNLAGIPLAAGALYPFMGVMLSPVFAGVAMAASSVSVVTNSLSLKFKRL